MNSQLYIMLVGGIIKLILLYKINKPLLYIYIYRVIEDIGINVIAWGVGDNYEEVGMNIEEQADLQGLHRVVGAHPAPYIQVVAVRKHLGEGLVA